MARSSLKDMLFWLLVILWLIVTMAYFAIKPENPEYALAAIFGILSILPWLKREAIEDMENRVNRSMGKLGKGKYARVLRMSRKPSMDEFKSTLAVTGVGVFLIGGLGFLVYYIWNFLPKWINNVFG